MLIFTFIKQLEKNKKQKKTLELVLGGFAIPSPGHGVHQAHQVEYVVHPPMSASGKLRYDFYICCQTKSF